MIILLNIICVILVACCIYYAYTEKYLQDQNRFLIGYIVYLHNQYKVKTENIFEFCYHEGGEFLPKEIVENLREEFKNGRV